MPRPKRFRPPDPRWRKRPGEKTGRVRYTFRGLRTEEITPFETLAEAEEYLHDLKAELLARHWAAEGGAPGERSRRGPTALTVAELAKAYLEQVMVPGRRAENTIKGQPTKLNGAVRWLGPSLAAHLVDTAVVEAGLARRRREKRLVRGKGGGMVQGKTLISSTTVATELAALKACYRWGIRQKLIPDPDAPQTHLKAVPWDLPREEKPKARTHRPRRIPEDQVKAIIRGLRPHKNEADLLILLGLVTGARGGDLERLEWKDRDGEAGGFRTETGKTGEAVLWPLPGPLAGFLAGLADEGRVFSPMPSFRRVMARTARLAGNGAGNSGYSVKAFRYTVASGLVTAGVHPRLIKALLGHALRDVTDGYERPSAKELRAALGALPWMPEILKRVAKWGKSGGKGRVSPGT